MTSRWQLCEPTVPRLRRCGDEHPAGAGGGVPVERREHLLLPVSPNAGCGCPSRRPPTWCRRWSLLGVNLVHTWELPAELWEAKSGPGPSPTTTSWRSTTTSTPTTGCSTQPLPRAGCARLSPRAGTLGERCGGWCATRASAQPLAGWHPGRSWPAASTPRPTRSWLRPGQVAPGGPGLCAPNDPAGPHGRASLSRLRHRVQPGAPRSC